MSEAALAKIQKDCAKLEGELAIYKNSQPLSQSCNEIVGFVNATPEPFSAAKGDPNPWHSSGGGGGGCSIC
ncbi:hypothetical protein B484DRAFT_445506 [Ochromonadaceae sp. CCMP2298]|nr:hypothetical protein B484DRAFT_445506 [Ochromonadaceae sp. CCMP2298]|eukprot:CAMPEP_0173198136 /NCGR_PEP_ID=MMETSP1141-20130122/16529_1 /TAXON_ID=483371 /ORGANISM="non described non described, Strain CCMP2298" /LENGTH=70 /DNA_ID=CAMNT_0014122915 /DNA_START=140 /DNA_END=352 /DNA_ORIENTATION=-